MGDAVRVSWRMKGAPSGSSGFYDYYVAVSRGVASVSCSLHIVESIQALPAEA